MPCRIAPAQIFLVFPLLCLLLGNLVDKGDTLP
jgi:hypothetical protein